MFTDTESQKSYPIIIAAILLPQHPDSLGGIDTEIASIARVGKQDDY